MADDTQTFKNDPVAYLQQTPCTCVANFLQVQRLNIMVDKDEDMSFAQLRVVNPDVGGTWFYILGWQEQNVAVGQLGNQADYFFTGPLTGCTFAVDKNWYSPKVVHVNQQNINGTMNVNGMLNTVGQQMGHAKSWVRWMSTPNITVVESAGRNEGERYNIYGVRGKLGWTFYQQIVQINGHHQAVTSLRELYTSW